MSRSAQHKIKFEPQRIVGFISDGCGGNANVASSARADWMSRTCNASLRELAAGGGGGGGGGSGDGGGGSGSERGAWMVGGGAAAAAVSLDDSGD